MTYFSSKWGELKHQLTPLFVDYKGVWLVKDYTLEKLEMQIVVVSNELRKLRQQRTYIADDCNDCLSSLRTGGWKSVAAIIEVKGNRLLNLSRQQQPNFEEIKDNFRDIINYGYYGLLL